MPVVSIQTFEDFRCTPRADERTVGLEDGDVAYSSPIWIDTRGVA